MDFGLLIYSLPLWVLFILTASLSIGAVELGSYSARLALKKRDHDPEAPLGTLVASVLGLLGFILAFTFGMAGARFDLRKQLVLENANSIGTTYLRAGLLPDSQKQEVRRLLLEYVDVVLGITVDKLPQALKRTEEITDQLWLQAETLPKEDIDSELRSLFVSSLNQTIDLHTSRKTVALEYRIPGTIWLAVMALMVVSMLTVGYQVGMSTSRRLRGMPIMVGSFSVVIVMIADIDRPIAGHFSVSQQPLIEVREMMLRNPPHKIAESAQH